MADLPWPNHRPSVSRPYGVDWTAFLRALDVELGRATADTVASQAWDLSAAAGAPTNPAGEMDVIDGTKTWLRLTGGTAGTTHAFVNRITTAAGDVHEQVCTLYIE